jgi:hypothetical protein
VCRMDETFEITSTPTNAANTKKVSQTSGSLTPYHSSIDSS